MYTHLLVPTDGSKLSDKAVTHAIALAQALQAKVTFFYASPDYPLPAYADGVVYEPMSKREYTQLAAQGSGQGPRSRDDEGHRGGRRLHAHAQHRIRRRGRRFSRPPKKAKCDVIVMASHGRRGLPRCCWGAKLKRC